MLDSRLRIDDRDLVPYDSVVVIADMSDSATASHKAIMTDVRLLIARIPPALKVWVGALGDHLYGRDVNHLLRRVADYGGCRGVSLIRPNLEAIAAGTMGSKPLVVVVGDGTIFDLEDFRTHRLSPALRFVAHGTGMGESRIRSAETADAIVEELHVRCEKVEIEFNGGMPLAWDNPAYCWRDGRLMCEVGIAFGIGFHARGGHGAPRATAQLSNGENRELNVLPVQEDPKAPPWQLLRDEAGSTIIESCLQGGQYICPLCRASHRAQELACPNTIGLGRPMVLDILRSAQFVLFRKHEDGYQFLPHRCNVLELGAEAAAVRADSRVTVHRYDPGQQRWLDTGEPLSPFHRLEGGVYALVGRPQGARAAGF